VVRDLIALTFAIRRHSPTGKRIGGLIVGLVAATLTWVITLVAAPAARPDVLGLILTGWLAGWLIGPILTTASPALRPEFFAFLPMDRRRLGAGLLASTFVGVGALVSTAGLLALAGYGVTRGGSPLPTLAVAVVAAVLFLVSVVAASRACYAVLGAAMRTRLGVEIAGIQYGLLLAGLFSGWLMVAPVLRSVPVFLSRGFDGSVVSTVIATLPSGWPVRAVNAAAAGDLAAAAVWLAALAALMVVAVGAAAALVIPRPGRATERSSRRRTGWLLSCLVARLPPTPLGGVVAKELLSWRRDPWRTLEIRSAVWFGVFVGVFGIVAGLPAVAGLSGAAVALTIALSGANLYGQDGTALWQLVVAQSSQAIRADVRGRQIGLVTTLGLPAVALSAAGMAVTGITVYAVPIAAVLVAVIGVGSGVAVIVSIVGVAPGVDPHLRVNATDVGENGFAIQAANWSTLALISPTAYAVSLPVLTGTAPPLPAAAIMILIGLVNGLVVATVGGRIARHRLTTRLPETFGRVRYPRLGARRATTAGAGR
jgi:ABC-2 type transport system permease protein